MVSVTVLNRPTGKVYEFEGNLTDFYDSSGLISTNETSMKIRLGFLRKVYSLLFTQIFSCVIVGFVMIFSPKVRFYIHNNDWLMSLSLMLSVSIMIALHSKRKDSPTNLILLTMFMLVEAFSFGVCVAYFDMFSILQGLLLTVAVVGGLSVYTFQTKKDFSIRGSILYAVICIQVVAGILQILLGSTTVELLLSIAVSLLLSLFIIIDTQDLAKRHSPDEYVLATINFYIDFVNAFCYGIRKLENVFKK